MFTASMLAEAKEFAERARAESKRRCPPPPRMSPQVAALETLGTAFTLGMLEARSGDSPGSLVASTAIHLLVFFGDECSSFAPHAEALATGALVARAYRHGARHKNRVERTASASSPQQTGATGVAS